MSNKVGHHVVFMKVGILSHVNEDGLYVDTEGNTWEHMMSKTKMEIQTYDPEDVEHHRCVLCGQLYDKLKDAEECKCLTKYRHGLKFC